MTKDLFLASLECRSSELCVVLSLRLRKASGHGRARASASTHQPVDAWPFLLTGVNF
jgi:hypothetical protein